MAQNTDRLFTFACWWMALLLWLSAAACSRRNPPAAAAILLFDGTGTSPHDVAALESILKNQRFENQRFDYVVANSFQLNRMSEEQMRRYRLMIIPGGNFVEIGNGLTAETAGRIRNAVQTGVNYLGICAGAFFAGDSCPRWYRYRSKPSRSWRFPPGYPG